MKKYYLLGDNIKNSMSPAFHNAWLGGIGLYSLSQTDGTAEQFNARMEMLLDDKDFSGSSITSPHKIHAFKYAVADGWHISRLARMAGACNTFYRMDGRWAAENTDIHALINLLGAPQSGAVIIGTGGTARATIAALEHVGCGPITVVSRGKCGSFLGYPMVPVAPSAAGLRINCTPSDQEADIDWRQHTETGKRLFLLQAEMQATLFGRPSQ